MKIPRRITIAAAATVTAILAATGIAMATPASTGLPGPATGNPATGMMDGQVEPGPDGDGPQADWMDQMHADRWKDGDADAMHSQMGAMQADMGAMHGDAEQMQQHHARMTERDPQMQQRHDDMVDRYPEMREHMDAAATLREPGR